MSAAVVAAPVVRALSGLQEAFPGRVRSDPDGLGGAVVSLAGAVLPAHWPVREGELMFVVPYNFPAIPVYPYYVAAALAPAGVQLANGMQRVQWRELDVIQLSLRHNRWRPGVDTVVGSVLQAMDWLASR